MPDRNTANPNINKPASADYYTETLEALEDEMSPMAVCKIIALLQVADSYPTSNGQVDQEVRMFREALLERVGAEYYNNEIEFLGL